MNESYDKEELRKDVLDLIHRRGDEMLPGSCFTGVLFHVAGEKLLYFVKTMVEVGGLLEHLHQIYTLSKASGYEIYGIYIMVFEPDRDVTMFSTVNLGQIKKFFKKAEEAYNEDT